MESFNHEGMEGTQADAYDGNAWDVIREDLKLDPWRADAACRDADPDLFFPSVAERPETKDAREGRAKAICRDCPVREECLEYALRKREPWGIWGGVEFDNGKIVDPGRKKRSSAA